MEHKSKKPESENLSRRRRRIFDVRLKFVTLAVCVLALGYFLGHFLSYMYMDYKNERSLEQAREILEGSSETSGASPLPYTSPLPTTAASSVPKKASIASQEPAINDEYIIQNPEFARLLKQYPDFVGWIRIDNTPIDYPVMQSHDEDPTDYYYLKRNINGEGDVNGSIFLDHDSSVRGLSDNTIIYGHNMKSGKMFGTLKKFQNPDYYNSENRSIVQFDTLYGEYKWKIFAAYITTTKFNYIVSDLEDEQVRQTFIDEVRARSMLDTDVDVSPDDKILTLSTCTSAVKNGRMVIHARLMRPGEDDGVSRAQLKKSEVRPYNWREILNGKNPLWE